MTDRAFPEESKTAFEGLLHLGYLETEVKIPGHMFVIRTLRSGERLEISSLCREFENSYAYDFAYQAATVAASLVSVDGKPFIVGEKARSVVRAKFEYVTESWYDPVINHLWKQYQDLEQDMYNLIREAGW